MLPFVQVLFRSTLTDIDYGKADTQRRGADALFLDAGPVIRARTGCALARTETSLLINTLSTMVRGLEAKGYVGHKAYGGTYQYYPLVSEEEFSRKTLKGVVSKYFDNSYLGVVSSLVREEKISVDDLRDLIRQIESQTEKR